MDVCSRLGESWPNVERAPGCTDVGKSQMPQRGHILTQSARWDRIGTTFGRFLCCHQGRYNVSEPPTRRKSHLKLCKRPAVEAFCRLAPEGTTRPSTRFLTRMDNTLSLLAVYSFLHHGDRKVTLHHHSPSKACWGSTSLRDLTVQSSSRKLQ